MARAIWSGSISFGLVNIPVKLFSAVSRRDVQFHMLHDKDGARIQQKRFCSVEGVEVPYEHVVKGYEFARGRYVTVTSAELEAADPHGSKTIDLEDFVELTEIDPIFFDTTYYLGPDKGAEKPYGLLLETLRQTGKVGIARFVLRTKQQLCCLRPMGAALALSIMNYADEVNAIDDLELPKAPAPSSRELELAGQLVASLTARFDAARYKDEHREKLLALLEKKAAGEEVVTPPEEPAAQVVNLADALARSLAASRRGRPAEANEPAAAGPAHGAPEHRGGEAGEVPDRGVRHAPRRAAARTAGKRKRAT